MCGPREPYHLIEVCLIGLLSVVILDSVLVCWAKTYGFFKSHRTLVK